MISSTCNFFLKFCVSTISGLKYNEQNVM